MTEDNTTTMDGSNMIIAFTKIGDYTFTPPHGYDRFHVLIVGGGGGGGMSNTQSDPAGGGGGGLVFIPNIYIKSPVKLSVGDGGQTGSNGKPTYFGSIIAQGGGFGGCDYIGSSCETGSNGGSGGGGGPNTKPGGQSNQEKIILGGFAYGFGNPGGHGKGFGNGGGGGGAGGKGEDTDGAVCANGGDGLSEVTIEGITYDFRRLFGEHGDMIDGKSYFAGGGAGGGECNGVGGKGGGGNSNSVSQDCTDCYGKTGTGGGGGGGNNFNGKKGGSGIILIRGYPSADKPSCNYGKIAMVISLLLVCY